MSNRYLMADAASHLIGSFMSLYWYENPDKSIDELLESGVKKPKKTGSGKLRYRK